MKNIKVLSIKEPWATLIKEKVKTIETRSWKTNYRGEIYIHASLAKVNMKQIRNIEILELIKDDNYQYGNIICKCKLIDCKYMDEEFIKYIKKNNQEYICGRYEIGRYAWILDDIQILEEVIPAKGKLNIWNYTI